MVRAWRELQIRFHSNISAVFALISADFNKCLTLTFLVFQGVIHMLKNLPHANVGSIITGVLCLAVLIGLKHVNERFKNKLKVPIPGELLVVSVNLP